MARAPSPRSLTLGVIQTRYGENLADNILRTRDFVREAASKGAQVVLPSELFQGPYFCVAQDERWFAAAHPWREHPCVAALAPLAGELGVVIPISIFERDGPHYYNSVVIADAVRFVNVAAPGGFVVGEETIVDNLDATRVGPWVINQNMTAGFYGTTYDHDGNANKGACTMTYTPTLTGTGPRDVYVRFCGGSNRASNARYTVNYAGGSQTVLQDQRTLGGQWVKVGTWTFNGGTGGTVVLDNASTDGVVIGDAIKLVNVSP